MQHPVSGSRPTHAQDGEERDMQDEFVIANRLLIARLKIKPAPGTSTIVINSQSSAGASSHIPVIRLLEGCQSPGTLSPSQQQQQLKHQASVKHILSSWTLDRYGLKSILQSPPTGDASSLDQGDAPVDRGPTTTVLRATSQCVAYRALLVKNLKLYKRHYARPITLFIGLLLSALLVVRVVLCPIAP